MSLFQTTIANISVGGSLTSELDDITQQAIASVKQTGKPSSVTLKIDFKPLDADASQVQTRGKAKLKTADREFSAIFYTTDDNTLVRDNPEQMALPLKAVEKPAARVEPVAKAS